MGKRIIVQRRGKGSSTYKAPSFRYVGSAKMNSLSDILEEGKVMQLLHCQGHSAPLVDVKLMNGNSFLMIAPCGIRVGDAIQSGSKSEVKTGNILPLAEIPEGAPIYNIEGQPGDGGKFVRSSGNFAKVVTKMNDTVTVQLPSKKQHTFNSKCRAIIGSVSGSGRTEKPFLSAGKKYYAMKAKNKLWPKMRGAAMNAVDHPFGNKRTSRKSKARVCPKNAPPGRKVGMIRARRTGRKKR